MLEKVLRDPTHNAFTSALTFYEVEEALYRQLGNATKGISHASTLLVPMARSIVVQMTIAVRYYRINVLNFMLR